MRSKLVAVSMVTLALLVLAVAPSFGQFSIGADVVSRYVWRGTDFGNSAAVQPGLSYSSELSEGTSIEVGAWGSWSITGADDGNENDLYATVTFGDFGLTVTDYFFPTFSGDDDFFKYGNDDAIHGIEVSGSYGTGPFSVLAGYFLTGGEGVKESLYLEASLAVPTKVEGMEASLILGAGNESYTTDSDFNVVNIGLSVSKDSWSASYIINPEQETSFLVFGKSF